MSKILFVGDSHGNVSFIADAFKFAKREGVTRIVSVGDWGSWPGKEGDYFFKFCSDRATATGIPFYVCRGNHDSPDRLEYADALSWTDEGHKEIAPNLYFLGRSGVWEWDGYRYAVCGGAYSIDKQWRRDGLSWWREEGITLGDLENLEAAMEEKVWDYVDILITHDAPTSLPVWDGFIKDDPESERSRTMIDIAHKITHPGLQFAGHYHRNIEFDHNSCRVVVLSCDPVAAAMWRGDRNSFAVIDASDTLSYKVHDILNLP